MMRHGLLARPARENIIRLCPPLTINEKEVIKAATIIRHCIENGRGSCGDSPDPCAQDPDPNTKSKLLRCAELLKKVKSTTNKNTSEAVNRT